MDCNGARIGSVLGAAAGRRNFGGILAEKLNDTIMPSMIGFQKVKMKELARRCAKVRRNICR